MKVVVLCVYHKSVARSCSMHCVSCPCFRIPPLEWLRVVVGTSVLAIHNLCDPTMRPLLPSRADFFPSQTKLTTYSVRIVHDSGFGYTVFANMDLRGNKEPLVQSRLARGQLTKGKWYCECEQAARCLTTKKSGPNQGRKCALSLFCYPTRPKLT
jgi:hypothetical protein